MRRSLIVGFACAAVLLAAASMLATPSPAAAGSSGNTSQTVLNVRFRGTADGKTYVPGRGEKVDGSLQLNAGTETVRSGAVTLGGGSEGLTFTPGTPLTSAAGGVTTSVSVEALAESATDGNKGIDTLLSLAGSAYYRFKNGLTGPSEAGMNGPGPAYAAVSGAARTPGSDRFDHVRLVYTYVSAERSELSTYVNGCQVGQTLVNSAPAEAAAATIGFGNEVHPGATSRGFLGRLGGLAVTTFTGDVPKAVLPDAPEAPTGTVKPASMIPVSACDSPQQVQEKAANVVPTTQQLAWQQEELTGFIHFGPNTFTNSEIGTGTEPVTTFAPTDVDTDEWAAAYKKAGFKKVILVAKHHDGFVLYPSRYTQYSVKFDTAWKDGNGDLVREFVDSMHKYGLKVGFYLSPADLHEAQTGGRYADGSSPKDVTIPTLVPGDSRAGDVRSGKLPSFHLKLDDYNTYFLNQMYELLTQYGRVDEVWLDGANPTTRPQSYDWRAWYQVIGKLAPHAVVFNGQGVRWIGNEDSQARETEWSVLPFSGDPTTTRYNHEQDVEWADDLGGDDRLTNAASYLAWYPGECDARMEPGWFWHASDSPKPLSQLKTM
ncbi:MAG: alpha-L-fucosidase, partial [Nocardioides sp.]|nr:alpha-L-fucosidase [Nocardioides sp.]